MNETELTAQGADPRVWKRYRVPAGRFLMVRDRVETETIGTADDKYLVASRVTDLHGKEVTILAGDQIRVDHAQTFEPWGTVLMVGKPRLTESGREVTPPEGLEEGRRVLISESAGRDVKIGDGEASMIITTVPFEAIHLVDMGETEADDGSIDPDEAAWAHEFPSDPRETLADIGRDIAAREAAGK
jgi:hypothetical protein